MTTTITIEEIDSLERAEELRVIRNECAEWMTKDTSLISPERQRVFFWEKIATDKIEGYLVYSDGNPAAYGLLVWDDKVFGRAWSSNGVKVNERGKGFGRLTTIENARRAHAYGVPVWAEIRRDNAGEQKISRGIGYVVLDTIERDGHVIDVMRCDKLAEDL